MPEVATATETKVATNEEKKDVSTATKPAKKGAKVVPAKPAPAKKGATPAKAEGKKGLSQRKMDTLKALKSGKELSHADIAKVTGREKGNMLRDLTEDKLVETKEVENVRGFVYVITKQGKAALEAAK